MLERKHLHRLSRVWAESPVYFVTTCTFHRRKLLANSSANKILAVEWGNARPQHGWLVGRYVIMPDHVHFFCRPSSDSKPLSRFLQGWKQWTAKKLAAELNLKAPIWQPEFFDHILRSGESYSEKWNYVWRNPVRAGLVESAEDWPWQGEVEDLRL